MTDREAFADDELDELEIDDVAEEEFSIPDEPPNPRAPSVLAHRSAI